MEPFDYAEGPRRRGNRQLILAIASEVAKEALHLLARVFYEFICAWVSFILVLSVQTIPFWFVVYFYFTLGADAVKDVHWVILAIPVVILTYISRSLFTIVLNFLHSLAEKQWGRAYSRRIPRWMVSKRVLATTRDLKSSFSALVSFYNGLRWLSRQPRRWRESEDRPRDAVCLVCKNLNQHRSYSGSTTIKYYDLWNTRESCVICATLLAGVARHYPPTDLSNRFYFQWKRYRPGEEIILTWDGNKRKLVVELPNIITAWPRMSFYCLGKGPDLPFISSPRAAVDDTQSEATMHRVMSWILACTTEHEHCTRNQPKSMPDRVLDIGDSHESTIKLVDTRNELGYYACLSYCWGLAPNLKTLDSNKELFMSGVPMEALPKTIYDAVVACRRLSIRYLWVDTLCIIQNCDEDRERQLPKMASIYENAFVTMAATKAKGHEEGLHSGAEPREVYLDRIPAQEIGHGLVDDVFVRLEYPDNGGIRHWDIASPDQHHDEEWPLLTRAWVFQERLLSPRMLHFAKRELVWECRTGVFCDCGREHEAKSDDLEFRRLISSKSIKTSNATPAELRALWYAIVERYSKLVGNLTNESDAFPALAGLASRISGLLEDEYVAGIWRSKMVEGLLWASKEEGGDERKGKPESWRAPSWSWASMMDEVSYKHSTMAGWARPVLQNVYARVVKVDCTFAGLRGTGPMTSAALTLSGWVSFATVSVGFTDREHWLTGEMHRIFHYELVWQHDGHVSTISPDHPEDVVDGKTALCLRLARTDDRDWYLVLVKEPSAPSSFKRLGLYQGGDVAWDWFSPASWRRRAEHRYHEEKHVLRIV